MMKCTEVKDLLSQFHDGELDTDLRSRVADHLRECSECAEELASFERISQLALALKTSPGLERDWNAVEERLDSSHRDETNSSRMLRTAGKGHRSVWFMPLAASIGLVLSMLGIGLLTGLFHGEHDHFMETFATYVDEFQRDPNAAQEFLLAHYQSKRVTPEQATTLVGYQPALANGLPEGLALEATYVIRMPCCDCVQCLCNRPDGSVVAVFEHDEENAGWFGKHPSVNVQCGGVECQIVELDEKIAATWRHQKRFITLIGARDVADVNQFIAWINDRRKMIHN